MTLPNSTRIEYLLDGIHRRIGRKVNGSLTASYLYRDDLAIAAELDANGAVRSRFVYATHANVPEYLVRGGKTYRLITDERGSVRLAIDTASGVIAQRMDYDAWGNVTSDTNPGFQPFGFAGGLYDADTGLVRFGARDYDAVTGRWTGKDPILFDGEQANLYVYVGSSPTNFVDPQGTIWHLIAGGAAVSFGANAAGQWLTTGSVDWGGALKAGAVGGLQGALSPGTSTSGAALLGAVVGAGQYLWTTPPCGWTVGGVATAGAWGGLGGLIAGATPSARSGGGLIPSAFAAKPSRAKSFIPPRLVAGIGARGIAGGAISQAPDPGDDWSSR